MWNMFKINQRNTRAWSYFGPFSSVSIVDLKEVNDSLIVLVYVIEILRQSILFQKIGNGAVIKHVVGSTAERVYWFFFHRYFWNSRRSKK